MRCSDGFDGVSERRISVTSVVLFNLMKMNILVGPNNTKKHPSEVIIHNIHELKETKRKCENPFAY